MLDSEIFNTFDEKRGEFRSYGLTCEIWRPDLMGRPDRHNEIEINYLPQGMLTYLFQGSKITVPEKSLTLFWGLVPHQIIGHTGPSPYYVCTVPLADFLGWKLPSFFVDHILKGEMIIEDQGGHPFVDEFTFKNWIKDLSTEDGHHVTLLEIHARLLRMASRITLYQTGGTSNIHSTEISKVEKIALYIAKNYHHPIKVADVGRKVDLHPDHANVIFKKAFGMTLNEYLIQQRISHAKRKLISTDESITDILYECGFNSISRFNAAFRTLNDCTPREFRKRYTFPKQDS